MSSPSLPSAFSFKFGAGANNPSRSRSKHHPGSRTGSEANLFCFVSDGFSNMHIDSDRCFLFGSNQINSGSNINPGGQSYSSGNMDKPKVISEVCKKMKPENETDTEEVKTNIASYDVANCPLQPDPGFVEDRFKAANPHLLLGEVEQAVKYFNECLESKTVACLDGRVVIGCVDGIEKAWKVAECTNRAATLLEQKITHDNAVSALEVISEALSISTYSEKLLEMAKAYFQLGRYTAANERKPSDFQSAYYKTSSCKRRPSKSECPSRPNSYRRFGFFTRSPFERACPNERETCKSYG